MFKKYKGATLAFAMAMGCGAMQAESITTTLTKVADLPLTGDGAAKSPQDARGGILQIGNDLWFTTYAGGLYSYGAVVTYNLSSHTFTTQHSFGVTDPQNPISNRYDGVNPYKETLAQGPNGLIYYTTSYGGSNNTADNNGGAVGSFNPSTVQTVGTTTIFSGGVTGTTSPRNLSYSSPIYVAGSGGGGALYFNTYGGGATNEGTVQKITLNAQGVPTGPAVQVTQLVGNQTTPNSGKQAMGGMTLVGTKIYYTTGPSAGTGASTLQVLDTTTDVVTVLSTGFNPVSLGGTGANGGYNAPIYDAERNALYTVALSGGILKWDINTATASLLANSREPTTVSTNYANPILFGESIYYIKQANGAATADNFGGQIWRYDLETASLTLLYNLKDFGAKSSNQSGSFSLVSESGVDSLYFLTGSDTVGDPFGAMYRLDITVVPEPGTVGLCVGGLVLVAWRARRRVCV